MNRFFIFFCLALFCVLPSPPLSSRHKRHRNSSLIQKEIPRTSFDSSLFLEKLKEQPPEWMSKQIQQDLALYAKTGISQEMLDAFFQKDRIAACMLVRFYVKNGLISCSLNRPEGGVEPILAALNMLNQFAPLPDLDFIVSLGDYVRKEYVSSCPCFVFAKQKDIDSLILIPDSTALSFSQRFNLQKRILQGNQLLPWQRKKEQAFWRGSTTGTFSSETTRFSKTTWHTLPRSKLVLLSLRYPDFIDARFTNVVQCTPEAPKLMKELSMVSPPVSEVYHLHYKYLIDVDGNSCSYDRCFWILLSNSLLIKQQSNDMQWYYGAMKPYEHFLPLKEDCSDLIEKITWAKEHDAEAQAIAEAGSEFAKTHLSPENTLLYLYHLLITYSQLQR